MDSQTISIIAACVSFFSALSTLCINTVLVRKKEKQQLRIICSILLAESEHNRLLVEGLIKKHLMTKEFIKSQELTTEWMALKKESVFYRMNRDDFEVLISYYKQISALQQTMKKPQMSDGKTTITDMDELPDFVLSELNSGCEKACTVLSKYANS